MSQTMPLQLENPAKNLGATQVNLEDEFNLMQAGLDREEAHWQRLVAGLTTGVSILATVAILLLEGSLRWWAIASFAIVGGWAAYSSWAVILQRKARLAALQGNLEAL